MHKISVIIPIYNEADNIVNLLKEIKLNLSNIYLYEIIIIDDFSSDNPSKIIFENFEDDKKSIKLIRNSKNKGQSFSIFEGCRLAINDTIVTLDGDGQNDPKDIQKIVDKFFQIDELKLVAGIRTNRKDNIVKIFSSKIANFIRSSILKDNCPDTGCSLKVFSKSVFLNLPYFNGMHRYIPALFLASNKKISYEVVSHRFRKFGKSKYGFFDRLFKGIFDIVRVLKLIKGIKNG